MLVSVNFVCNSPSSIYMLVKNHDSFLTLEGLLIAINTKNQPANRKFCTNDTANRVQLPLLCCKPLSVHHMYFQAYFFDIKTGSFWRKKSWRENLPKPFQKLKPVFRYSAHTYRDVFLILYALFIVSSFMYCIEHLYNSQHLSEGR